MSGVRGGRGDLRPGGSQQTGCACRTPGCQCGRGALGPQAALRQEQTLPVLRWPRPKSPGLSGRVVSATSRSTWLRGALGHVVWRRLRLLATRGSLKSDAEWLGLQPAHWSRCPLERAVGSVTSVPCGPRRHAETMPSERQCGEAGLPRGSCTGERAAPSLRVFCSRVAQGLASAAVTPSASQPRLSPLGRAPPRGARSLAAP